MGAPHVNVENAVFIDPQEAAALAGLVYVSDEEPGITRKRTGKSFAFYQNGTIVRDAATRKRILALAIPPAYQDVWICPLANGHLQATGRDDRGRKQYRYHAKWGELRNETKFARMLEFAEALPKLRGRVDADMRKSGLGREKVIATVVHLLETTLIRVGNEDYARDNESYGLTTLRRKKHVVLNGSDLTFHFKGKSGKEWNISLHDRRTARIVRDMHELREQHLFHYKDETGSIHAVTSSDVNDYLHDVTGEDFTAKDFRTWAGTVLAVISLLELEYYESASQAKKNVVAAIKKVAARLGNTPAVCRKSYIHPVVLAAYVDGQEFYRKRDEVTPVLGSDVEVLHTHEAVVLAFLRKALEG